MAEDTTQQQHQQDHSSTQDDDGHHDHNEPHHANTNVTEISADPIIPTASTSMTNISPDSRHIEDSQPQASGSSHNPPKSDDTNTDSAYHLKWIPWNSGMIPVVMQSINGPCPLIAIMNVLLLREKIKLPSMLEQITESQLLAYIGECIMDSVPTEARDDENILLNLEQNINDAIEILPRLKSGLDVNIRFTGITDFEYTPECIIFDLLRIPLYHGWLSDPGLIELQNAIGQQSYNQLVDNIITNKSNRDPVMATRVLIAEEFLERTASQLTQHGLDELHTRIKDNEIGILFRNNHFLTLFKREGDIYTLVTDHGYLTEDNIVWETLDNIEGAGRFFDANFQLSEMTNRQVTEMNAIDERQQQMVNDYLVALSLKEEEAKQEDAQGASSQRELEDLEVAKKLQAEEDRFYAEMISKEESNKPGDRQVATGQSGLSDNSAPTSQQAHLQTPLTRGESSGGASMQQPTYAQTLGKRSIWGQQDEQMSNEQAESTWDNQAAIRSNTTNFSNQMPCTNLPSRTDNNQEFERPPASSRSGAGQARLPDSQALPTQQVVNPSSQQQQARGSSNARRSRSEKSSKESNCIVH